ncbi:glycosyltransferase 28 domain protein [Desulfovibrio sp. X2]|uniref:glycosyltransferase family protein n=1 Tax=Desulfovibrio sp. X2 TaxID=941449 RepID=UPI000358AC95|nr:glycosyltransferase [Desulfovibrio sp. X2]EPR44125.1 glycosyltransferase 28 domain protein [Desulfovibrio sp. X2]
MKVVFYSQHVLGVGHFFRSLTLAAGLAPDEVVLVSGGRQAPELKLPQNVREVHLPSLSMDAAFRGLHTEDGADVEVIKAARRDMLLGVLERERPDVFLIELFPFGRKKFRFELEPALEACRAAGPNGPAVVCSLRDILVEREDMQKYEHRVLATLEKWFDLVLVHADQDVQCLDETFPRTSEIPVPVAYTGFVAERPAPGARERGRAAAGLGPAEKLVVASAGGGQVGFPLLNAAVEAFGLLADRPDYRLRVLTGPFMPEIEFARLKARASDLPNVQVQRFEERFLDLLAAADLSISQAGYNTSMNVLAAKVPALVLPFDANTEQARRAAKLEKLGALAVIGGHELFPQGLVARICEVLTKHPFAPSRQVNLDGAANSAILLRRLVGKDSAQKPGKARR